MKFFAMFIFFSFMSTSSWAQVHSNSDLEEILISEIAQLALNQPSDLQAVEQKNNTERISKLDSLKEIYSDYLRCSSDEVQIHRTNLTLFTIIAFSCNLSETEILSSEIAFKNENDGLELYNYQSMVMTKSEISLMSLDSLLLSDNLTVVGPKNEISPAIQTLLNLAKVGVPVYLSFKTAKIISPVRTDWQKHIIAGSIISGITVLTSQALIRTYNNRNGSKLSNNQINVLASFSGLLGSFAAGVAKEARDKWTGKGTPDKMDALYTGLGGAIVSVIVAIPIPTKKPKKRINLF